MTEPITARTFPIGEDGKFQSEPAEAAYQELAYLLPNARVSRWAFQRAMQRCAEAEDRCRAEYEEFRRQREEETKNGA